MCKNLSTPSQSIASPRSVTHTSSAQASAASAAAAAAKLIQTEEQLVSYEASLRLATEKAVRAERDKEEATESMYPGEER